MAKNARGYFEYGGWSTVVKVGDKILKLERAKIKTKL